ncbi:hypothetical protein TeGR_g5619, partial [Tetraparma gracilis]
ETTQQAGSVKVSDIKKVSMIKPKASPGGAPPEAATTFVVKASSRSLFLKADTPADCSRWVRCMQMQMDLRSGGTAAGPKCKKNQRESNGGGDKFEIMIRNIEKTMETLEIMEGGVAAEGKEEGKEVWGGRLEFEHDK